MYLSPGTIILLPGLTLFLVRYLNSFYSVKPGQIISHANLSSIPNKKNTYYSLRNNLSRRRFEVDGSVYLIFEIFRGTFRNFLGNVFQWRYEAVRISILPCSLKYRAAAICEPITTATRRWCTRTFSYTAAQGTRSGRERVTPWNIGYIDFNHYCRV